MGTGSMPPLLKLCRARRRPTGAGDRPFLNKRRFIMERNPEGGTTQIICPSFCPHCHNYAHNGSCIPNITNATRRRQLKNETPLTCPQCGDNPRLTTCWIAARNYRPIMKESTVTIVSWVVGIMGYAFLCALGAYSLDYLGSPLLDKISYSWISLPVVLPWVGFKALSWLGTMLFFIGFYTIGPLYVLVRMWAWIRDL